MGYSQTTEYSPFPKSGSDASFDARIEDVQSLQQSGTLQWLSGEVNGASLNQPSDIEFFEPSTRVRVYAINSGGGYGVVVYSLEGLK